MTFDTIIVGIIVLLAALYAGRKLYRQARREESCGSCGGCCPTSNDREPNRKSAQNQPQDCAGCPSMSAGAPIGDKRGK